MKLPNLKYASGIKKNSQIKFGGLNMGLGAEDGEIARMRNLTSDHYPLLATRSPRWKTATLAAPGGLYSHDGLCWVDGTSLYYKGQEVGQVTVGRKIFGSMGAYIIILPDKAYYNTLTGEFGSMEASWQGQSLTFGNGVIYEEEADANAVRCEGVQWSDWFREGDTVAISGCTVHPENNKSMIIRAMDGDTLYFSENALTLDGDEGTEEYTEAGEMRILRSVPDLRYICQNENRLWGCSDTTIYASAWGDIFNWNTFDGIDSDSWTLDPGSPGVFTGCVAYKGYPIFFKEDLIYKIYGSVPSDFSCMGSATMGLQEGCAGSFAVADETLFYLGRSGITVYTGGIPTCIAEAFGTERFWNAAGGSDGLKYYVSMMDRQGQWGLYVYDTRLGQWHREDESHVTHFAAYDGGLYFLNDKGEIWLCGGARSVPHGAEQEGDIPWEAEFTDFTGRDPNKKTIGKLQLRIELEAGASLRVWIQFDSDGVWHAFGQPLHEGVKRSFYLPIVPRRCDHFRLKLTGTGSCRVYSLVSETRSGSELRSTSGRN